MTTVSCESLGAIRGYGLDEHPDVYECQNAEAHGGRGVCTITNPTGHQFGGALLANCETCPLYAPALQDDASESLSLQVKAVHFATAMARWAGNGFAMRSQDEINERLAICQACPNLVDKHCKLCGCACVETNQVMNKLALKSEKCPIGKWE